MPLSMDQHYTVTLTEITVYHETFMVIQKIQGIICQGLLGKTAIINVLYVPAILLNKYMKLLMSRYSQLIRIFLYTLTWSEQIPTLENITFTEDGHSSIISLFQFLNVRNTKNSKSTQIAFKIILLQSKHSL